MCVEGRQPHQEGVLQGGLRLLRLQGAVRELVHLLPGDPQSPLLQLLRVQSGPSP